MEDEDVALMLAFQAGEESAFEVLVHRHTKALLNWFFQQSRDLQAAEDCCQEVWIKVHRARDEYEPRSRFLAWLFRVARNLWIDRVRKTTRRPLEISLDAESDEGRGGLAQSLVLEGRRPRSEAERLEFAHALAEALQRLPETLREVFLLGEIEGLPYATVAEILDIPVGTVKSRMFHAVRRLQVAFSEPPAELPRGEGSGSAALD